MYKLKSPKLFQLCDSSDWGCKASDKAAVFWLVYMSPKRSLVVCMITLNVVMDCAQLGWRVAVGPHVHAVHNGTRFLNNDNEIVIVIRSGHSRGVGCPATPVSPSIGGTVCSSSCEFVPVINVAM